MARKTTSKKEKTAPRIYSLDVEIVGGPMTTTFEKKNPRIARTIQIRGDQTLADLHGAIFAAFDREDEHMYEFQFGTKPMDRKAQRYVMSGINNLFGDDGSGLRDELPPEEAENATLDSLDLRLRKQFWYWFDFGDDWWHKIRVVAIDQEVPKGKLPGVIEKVGESPPQYMDYDELDDE